MNFPRDLLFLFFIPFVVLALVALLGIVLVQFFPH